MSDLTPEEKRRIYEEEKARLEKEAQGNKKKPNPQKTDSIIYAFLAVVLISSIIGAYTYLSTPTIIKNESSSPSSSVTSSLTLEAIDAELKRRNSEEAEKNKVHVGEYTWGGGEDYDYIRGRIVNGSNKVVRYWKATAKFYDKHDNVIDTEFTNGGEQINPGSAKRFEIIHRHDPSAKTVRMLIDEVVFD